MIRGLIAFAVSLGVSLGVSAGWAFVNGAPQDHVIAQGIVSDSTHETSGDTTVAKGDTRLDSVGTKRDTLLAINDTIQRDTGERPHPIMAGQILPKTPSALVASTPVDSNVVKRLAGIFASMSARDAARVLSEMDNDDVQVILASLSRKQQAAILSTLPANRAALITRATLRDTL